MGDILDIPRVRYSLESNMDHVSHFLAFADPSHQMDEHARKLLATLASSETKGCLAVYEHKGLVGQVTLAHLGFKHGVPVRETAVLGQLSKMGAKPLSLAFALDLWAAPKGTQLAGVVYTEPVLDGNDQPHHLVVAEERGIRWLYARRLDPQRVWEPERKLIFSLL